MHNTFATLGPVVTLWAALRGGPVAGGGSLTLTCHVDRLGVSGRRDPEVTLDPEPQTRLRPARCFPTYSVNKNLTRNAYNVSKTPTFGKVKLQ